MPGKRLSGLHLEDGRFVVGMDVEHRADNRQLVDMAGDLRQQFGDPRTRLPMPSELEGTIVRGKRTRVARLTQADIELPEQPKMASFFAVQGQSSAGGES